jgi:phosphoserine phosphatase
MTVARLHEAKNLKLVVSDVDGTLMNAHSWQFLHKALGTWNKGQRYHEMFFRGRITYEEWARLDASLWRSLPLQRVKRIISTMPYTYGAKETISVLREKGFRVFLLSAGLSLVTERINEEIEVDGCLANDLIVRNGLLTGDVKVNVSFYSKDKVLRKMLSSWDLKMEDCISIGDDPTLIPLFKKVGLSIAFNPVDKNVERHADIVVKSKDLRCILPYILGEPLSKSVERKG